jgi:DNA polymerase III subunit gamma/tau
MVFYLKYRPQTLEDLIGQEAVKKTLLSAFSTGKLAHGYLFCGPKGTGKTSTARILAKMVNCQSSVISSQLSDQGPSVSQLTGQQSTDQPNSENREPKTDNRNIPCNECAACKAITDGSFMDLIEIDAASNRGIDDIRSLKETIKLAPTFGKTKVYIIDEVHMLSTEAFNALLKTLEEPPAHALFILATTEVHKVPATILSRVQKLDFKLATTQDLSLTLKKIADTEGLAIDENALTAIAKKAGGSFRDGVKLLDQLSSIGTIDQAAVDGALGSSEFGEVLSLLTDVAKNKPQEAVTRLLKQVEKGISVKELTISILDSLRQILLIKNGLGVSLVKPDVNEDHYPLLESLSSLFEINEVIRVIEYFQKSHEQLRYATLPTLPLEVAIVSSCTMRSQPVGEKQVIVQERIVVQQAAQRADTVVMPAKDDAIVSNITAIMTESTAPSNESSDDMQKIMDRWGYILETIRQHNYSLEALLRSSTKIKECTEHNVIFEVPYTFHQRIIEAPKSRDMLEAILADVIGRPVRVSTILGQRPISRDELANVEVAEEDDTIRMVAEIFSADSA